MKHIRKIISALILLAEMSALYILIPYITDSGLRNAFFTPPRAAAVIPACLIGLFLFVFINIFPRFTFLRIFGSRNQILEDGAALLQLFLSTVVAESLFVILYTLFLRPDGAGPGYVVGRLVSLLFLVLMESVLFWNGIIRVYTTSVQLGIKGLAYNGVASALSADGFHSFISGRCAASSPSPHGKRHLKRKSFCLTKFAPKAASVRQNIRFFSCTAYFSVISVS